MSLSPLPLLQPNIPPLSKHIQVRRPDDTTVVEVQFFVAVGAPADDAGHGEDGRVDGAGNAQHLVDETVVEIQVGAHGDDKVTPSPQYPPPS